ncbi:MAG: stage V sporulation protein E [Firmicutes bacterium]|nr:stage V sporulation protein E [Bacillota bacterium]
MRLPRKSPDFIIFLVTILLLSIGVIMVFSASAVKAGINYNDEYYFLKRQLLWSVIGILAMISMMNIDYYRLKRFAGSILLIGLFCLVLVLVPGVGKGAKGAIRWVGIGPLTFQPSEVMKLCLVFFMAKSLSNYQDRIQSFVGGVLPHLAIVGVVAGLVMLQPDLGTAVTICGTTFLLLFAAGARTSHLVFLALMGIALVAVASVTASYRMERWIAFLDPWKYALDEGFQTIQSLYAIGSGGLLGMGLGRSRQKLFYLPEQHTDFIFAILGEELGFIGAVLVVALFFLFAWRGLRVAITCPDSFGSLLATGITCMISLQAIINIGVVSGSLPVTGITLPFLSYGGSSLLFTMIGVGILLNISRYTTAK